MDTKSFLAALAIWLAASISYSQTATKQTNSTNLGLTDSLPKSIKIEGRYSGPWVTLKNKKLDGTTQAEIKQLSGDRWQGRFWGVWQQVPFDYTVEFDRVKNPPQLLETAEAPKTKKVSQTTEPGSIHVAGKAMIDGAYYDWAGTLSFKEFDIQFTGSRYEGHLEMTRVPEKKTAE